jgi:hypothetical protein
MSNVLHRLAWHHEEPKFGGVIRCRSDLVHKIEELFPMGDCLRETAGVRNLQVEVCDLNGDVHYPLNYSDVLRETQS